MKDSLTEEPVLRLPRRGVLYTLQTDWSAKGMGAILSQIGEDGEEGVIAYASRSNNKAESNYSSYHGELLAAVWGVQHFRPDLYGTPFVLMTDH